MVRRTGELWSSVIAFENLEVAARRAARGKRHVLGPARFLAELEPRILALQRELAAGTWRPGRAFTFEIHDPKRRTISAAPFADRVVHHALIGVLEPVFERRMVGASFACRQGKGTHKALDRAQNLVRRWSWFLKLDVASFFDSLGHDVVLDTVARCVKDAGVNALCETLVRGSGRRRGLPIGNLTSQWFANLVLDRLDHYVLERLRPRGYVRYMDDFVLFDESKAALRAAHEAVASFLDGELGLGLKVRATVLAPRWQGLPFLGWHLHARVRRLRPANKRLVVLRMRRRIREHARRRIDHATLVHSLRASIEHLRQGDTLRLRRSWLEGRFRRLLVTESDRELWQPRETGRELEQPRSQRALRQPQQERARQPQQEPRLAPLQGVVSPDLRRDQDVHRPGSAELCPRRPGPPPAPLVGRREAALRVW